MLVLDKPAGVAVHRGPKGGANLEDDFDALRFGLPRKPALAHRLDRDTAGCLVLGRHRKALEKLGLLFKQGRIGKTYWAIVAGGPDGGEGLIDKPLGRLDVSRGWWMKVDAERPAGSDALAGLRPRPMARRADRLARARAATGRTHQLRVHCASEGWPILGDAVYGERAEHAAATARAPGRGAAREGPAADRRRGAPPRAHAGDARGVRFRRRARTGARRRRASGERFAPSPLGRRRAASSATRVIANRARRDRPPRSGPSRVRSMLTT